MSWLLPRAHQDVEAAVEVVRPVCAAVREPVVVAVKETTARLDGVELAVTRVPKDALDDALASLGPAVRSGLEGPARRARQVHST